MQLANSINQLMGRASRYANFDFQARAVLQAEHLKGFRQAQDLALAGAKDVANLMSEGWTETQAANMLYTWLRDHGVQSFFHHPYAWFGERTRFRGINRLMYHQFMPSDRRLKEGDTYILDVAPIVRGYVCDIGYSGSLGAHSKLAQALQFLETLKADIPRLFVEEKSGGKIWQSIDATIKQQGYDNIHKLYPFSVLGHRVHRVPEAAGHLKVLNFGWQSYWSLTSRGLFSQLLNQTFDGSLNGLWAIEPHIGYGDFGCKFEEILVVRGNEDVTWLSQMDVMHG